MICFESGGILKYFVENVEERNHLNFNMKSNRSIMYSESSYMLCTFNTKYVIHKRIFDLVNVHIVIYSGFAWLKRRVLDFMIELIGRL
jgi:hypothetical protein